MFNLARVLVVGDDLTRSSALSRRLGREGFAAVAGDLSVAAAELSRDENPDLVMVDGARSPEEACDFAAGLKQSAAAGHVPVVLVAQRPGPRLRLQCIAAGLDDLLAEPFSDAVLLARIRPLVRLATMRTELRRRAETVRSFGLEASDQLPPPGGDGNYRVLVVAAAGAEVEALEAALAEGCRITRLDDVFAAGAQLLEKTFDALVVSVTDKADDALYLCGQIRNNPRLFNLPVLLIADRATFEDADRPYGAGASLVVARLVEREELQCAILTLVRRQRLRRDIRDGLAATLAAPLCDELTGLGSRDFLLVHLEHLCAAAASWRKNLSLLTFQVQNIAGIVQRFGRDVGDDLLRQVSDWITTLVRAEDFCARSGDREFCVALPETPSDEAQRCAHRISGVLLNTEFAVAGVNEPLGVWLQAGCAGFRVGDTATALLARAAKDLS